MGRDPNRPKVPDLLPLLKDIYRRNDVGCCLHVLVDDGNYDSTAFTVEWAREKGHPDCIAAAEMAARMTSSQISRASKRLHEWHGKLMRHEIDG